MVAHAFNPSMGRQISVSVRSSLFHVATSRAVRTTQKDPISKYRRTNLGAGQMA